MSTISRKLPLGSICIIPTWECDIACNHCVQSCTPRRNAIRMSLPELSDWVLQAIEYGFSPVCISGGEPFTYPESVKLISEQCNNANVPLVIQTNANWASTFVETKQFLESFMPISQLGFSVDDAHSQWVAISQIEIALAAAIECNIKELSVSIAYATEEERHRWCNYFKTNYPQVSVSAWPVVPIGRAINIKQCPNASLRKWNQVANCCPLQIELEPVVFPNGDLHLCYHLVMVLEEKDPLLAGSLRDISLADLVNNYSDPILDMLVAFGGKGLGYVLEDKESPYERLSGEFQGVCHFCYDVLSSEKTVKFLREALETKEVQSVLLSALESRFKLRENRITPQ